MAEARADLRSPDAWPPGRVLVVTATYEERATITALIAAVLAVDPGLQLLVVDDDSPDGTGALALAAAAAEPRVHVLVRRGRRGLGGAIIEGFREATRHGFDVAVNLDADLSHDPADIPRLLAALEPLGGRPADVVVGSRRVAGGRTLGWPAARHLASRFVGWFTRTALRVPVRDPSSGFRAVRLGTFLRLPGDLATGYAFLEHMLWEIHRAGGRIVEVPITFTNRRLGASKAGWAEVWRSGVALADLARRTWLGA